MQSNLLKNTGAEAPWLVIRPLSQEDSAAAAALRTAVAPMKGKLEGMAGRGPFNGVRERVAIRDSVTSKAATAESRFGWWAKPAEARKGSAMIHVHGGWLNGGTAQAFRNFVGHIALNACADAFIPDYRFAPEDRFRTLPRQPACFRYSQRNGRAGRHCESWEAGQRQRHGVSPCISHCTPTERGSAT